MDSRLIDIIVVARNVILAHDTLVDDVVVFVVIPSTDGMRIRQR